MWDALWLDENYRKWTSAFQGGSYFEGSLEKGSEIKFLGPENNGMYGIVKENIPFEKMYFLHKGEIKNGEKLPESYDSDAIESYDLTEKNGKMELTVTLNAPEDYIPYFAEVFPKALRKVKEISENF